MLFRSAGLLEKEGKIFPEDVQTIKRIEAFYQMIAHAKSDPEDIAFLWPSGADRASLAPAFGLSPTKIAIDRDLAPFPAPACPPELIPVWRQTKSLAKKFWERVHEDKRLSSSTRETALLALGATKNA